VTHFLTLSFAGAVAIPFAAVVAIPFAGAVAMAYDVVVPTRC